MENKMTKAEMVAKLEAAVGDSAYGKELIAALEATYDDADKKYGQDALEIGRASCRERVFCWV